MMTPVVTVEWLYEQLHEPNLVILDASQSVYKAGGTTSQENIQIVGARHFNLKNDFSDQNASFPNTFPSAKQFEDSAQKLGINQESSIVVYDNVGIYTSPRVWWMFHVMGHKQVSVLNGGLPEWIKAGFPTEQRVESDFPIGNYVASPDLIVVKSIEDIVKNIDSKRSILIDARSKGRFDGTAPEPREGLPSGHIPNSTNLPFGELLEDGKFKNTEELTRIFNRLDLGNEDLIFSCGSGVTACIDLLAAELVLDNKKSVYDGSWTEWAQSNKPIAKTSQ